MGITTHFPPVRPGVRRRVARPVGAAGPARRFADELEFTAGVSLPTPSGENLVFGDGSLWTQDATKVYRVRPTVE